MFPRISLIHFVISNPSSRFAAGSRIAFVPALLLQPGGIVGAVLFVMKLDNLAAELCIDNDPGLDIPDITDLISHVSISLKLKGPNSPVSKLPELSQQNVNAP
jgi:hypothetical protein